MMTVDCRSGRRNKQHPLWLKLRVPPDTRFSHSETTMATKKESQSKAKGLEDLFHDGLKDVYYA
ncbi:MAG: hypothetical protein EOS08_14735, partial [Mesorhizobium sp.]